MTKMECAIVQAYTGYCMLRGNDLDYFYKYLQELFGRPVYTHEIGLLRDEIAEKATNDFYHICATATETEVVAAPLLQVDSSSFREICRNFKSSAVRELLDFENNLIAELYRQTELAQVAVERGEYNGNRDS